MTLIPQNLEKDESNIISLDSARIRNDQAKQMKEYKNYLYLLDSQELIQETKSLLQKLEQSLKDILVFSKSHALLDEISTRVKSDSPRMTHQLNKMKENLKYKLEHRSLI